MRYWILVFELCFNGFIMIAVMSVTRSSAKRKFYAMRHEICLDALSGISFGMVKKVKKVCDQSMDQLGKLESSF
jgi:hypothetical protein